jgi:hypothetical protein
MTYGVPRPGIRRKLRQKSNVVYEQAIIREIAVRNRELILLERKRKCLLSRLNQTSRT